MDAAFRGKLKSPGENAERMDCVLRRGGGGGGGEEGCLGSCKMGKNLSEVKHFEHLRSLFTVFARDVNLASKARQKTLRLRISSPDLMPSQCIFHSAG